MATPDRDTVYTNDGTNRTVYSRESNSTGWFVGIIVALALLAIAYLVFSANSQPSSTTINNTPAVTTTTPAPADTNAAPMAPATNATPMAPADNTGTAVTPAAPVVQPVATAPISTPSPTVSAPPSARRPRSFSLVKCATAKRSRSA